MVSKLAILILVVLGVLSIGLPAAIVGRNVTTPLTVTDFLYNVGKFFGLLAFSVLSLQYVWTAKIRLLERLISYDRRVSIHRTLGFLGILLLSLHPILILGTYSVYGIPLVITFPLAFGFTAFLILLLIAGSTFLGRIWGVRYEAWKHIHWIVFGVLTLAFFHSIVMGSDLYGFFRFYWIVVFGLHALVLLAKLYHRIRVWLPTYVIKEVRKEAPNITTLIIEKPKNFFFPGQFSFLSIRHENGWEYWHPFSITSQISDDHFTVTIKGMGDFTNRVSEIQRGTRAKLDVGYGSFSPRIAKDSRYVMIAGGVGITPIYSILKNLSGSPTPPEVHLLYAAHHDSELLFREEIEKWFSAIPGWTLHYVISSQPEWKGEKGRLTPEKVNGLLKGDLSGTFFMCGPMGMIRSIKKYVLSKGIPRAKVRQEHFVFLP